MDRSQIFLARRYAQAFLDLVYDQMKMSDIASFEHAESFFKTHQHACFLMDLSSLSGESKEEAVRSIISTYHLPALVEKLLLLLMAHKRSALIGAVLSQFVGLYKQRAEIMTFSVESSLPLSEQEKNHIESFIKEQIKANIVCSYRVVPELIAGIRIHNEKYLWEYSAQAQLRALHTSIRR